MSYYKTIYGVKYDDALLTYAEKLKKEDNPLSILDVSKIVSEARDGKTITNVEVETLKKIYKENKLSDAAKIVLLEGIIFEQSEI